MFAILRYGTFTARTVIREQHGLGYQVYDTVIMFLLSRSKVVKILQRWNIKYFKLPFCRMVRHRGGIVRHDMHECLFIMCHDFHRKYFEHSAGVVQFEFTALHLLRIVLHSIEWICDILIELLRALY